MACLFYSLQGAAAFPAPALTAPVFAAGPIAKTGYWKRYCKFNDCSGNAVVNEDTDVDVDVPAPALNPPIIAIVPVRPVSCGEYRYWDGERCVDARYHNPYVGPR
jgi:hypothetical protein